MNFTLGAIELCGAIALFLWGTHMAQSGVQRALGPRLRAILGLTLSSRVRAFGAGIGITLLLQSSTATGLMAASFAANGMVDLVPGMAVMLGANVGTAVIVQLLAFDAAILSPILLVIGLFAFRGRPLGLVHDLGRAAVGIGLMLLALHQMLAILALAQASPEFRLAIGVAVAVPAIAFLLAGIAAWAIHSSVAVVLLVVSLASTGTLPIDIALIAVLGANLGTAINPFLEAGRSTPLARRLPLANLANRIAMIAIALPFIEPASGWLATTVGPAHAPATFHLALNLLAALITLPLLRTSQRLLERLLPDIPQSDPAAPLYLDQAARETPLVALGGAAREALRVADVLEDMLRGAQDALAKSDRRLIEETRGRDDVLDALNTQIKRYLTSIDAEELTVDDQRRLNQILMFSMSLEQAGDVVDRNLLPHMSKRLKRGLVGGDGDAELAELMDRLVVNLRTAASLFMTDDVRVARQLAAEKVRFRHVEREAVSAHFAVMRADEKGRSMQSALHLDLLRDLKLINSLIVAAAAYPVLDRTGELLPTRLASQP